MIHKTFHANFTWFIFIAFIFSSFTKCKDTFDIIFGGDVSFRTVIDYNVDIGRCTYNKSFEKIKPIFQEADEVVVNSEGVYGKRNELKPLDVREGQIYYLNNPKALQAIVFAGIRQVTVANNHLLDYGDSGVRSTLNELKKRNIKYSGIELGKFNDRERQEPLLMEHNGIRVAMLSYCDKEDDCVWPRNRTSIGPAIFDLDDIIEDLKELNKMKKKKSIHGIIVYLHQHVEFQIIAVSLERSQYVIKNLMKYADVIVSSHVHVATRHLYYRDKLNTGQLGNLLFPMSQTQDRQLSNDNGPIDGSKDKETEEKWYKLTKYRPDESTIGKLIKISFNKNGFVKDESQYMFINIDVDKNHCLFINPGKNPKWKDICKNGDKFCEGTTDCNFVECKGKDKKKKRKDKKIEKIEIS